MALFRASKRPNWKARLAVLASITIIYLGSYGLLSSAGRYRDNVSVLDDFGPPCLCVSSWDQWQPALIKAAYLPGYSRESPLFVTNGLGRFYATVSSSCPKVLTPEQANSRGTPAMNCASFRTLPGLTIGSSDRGSDFWERTLVTGRRGSTRVDGRRRSRRPAVAGQ